MNPQAADERRKSEEDESEGRKKSKKAGTATNSELARKSEMSQWFSLFADLDPGWWWIH